MNKKQMKVQTLPFLPNQIQQCFDEFKVGQINLKQFLTNIQQYIDFKNESIDTFIMISELMIANKFNMEHIRKVLLFGNFKISLQSNSQAISMVREIEKIICIFEQNKQFNQFDFLQIVNKVVQLDKNQNVQLDDEVIKFFYSLIEKFLKIQLTSKEIKNSLGSQRHIIHSFNILTKKFSQQLNIKKIIVPFFDKCFQLFILLFSLELDAQHKILIYKLFISILKLFLIFQSINSSIFQSQKEIFFFHAYKLMFIGSHFHQQLFKQNLLNNQQYQNTDIMKFNNYTTSASEFSDYENYNDNNSQKNEKYQKKIQHQVIDLLQNFLKLPENQEFLNINIFKLFRPNQFQSNFLTVIKNMQQPISLELKPMEINYQNIWQLNFSEPSLLYILMFVNDEKIRSKCCSLIQIIIKQLTIKLWIQDIDMNKLENYQTNKLNSFVSKSQLLYKVIKNIYLVLIFLILVVNNSKSLAYFIQTINQMIQKAIFEKMGTDIISGLIDKCLIPIITTNKFRMRNEAIICFSSICNLTKKFYNEIEVKYFTTDNNYNIIQNAMEFLQNTLQIEKQFSQQIETSTRKPKNQLLFLTFQSFLAKIQKNYSTNFTPFFNSFLHFYLEIYNTGEHRENHYYKQKIQLNDQILENFLKCSNDKYDFEHNLAKLFIKIFETLENSQEINVTGKLNILYQIDNKNWSDILASFPLQRILKIFTIVVQQNKGVEKSILTLLASFPSKIALFNSNSNYLSLIIQYIIEFEYIDFYDKNVALIEYIKNIQVEQHQSTLQNLIDFCNKNHQIIIKQQQPQQKLIDQIQINLATLEQILSKLKQDTNNSDFMVRIMHDIFIILNSSQFAVQQRIQVLSSFSEIIPHLQKQQQLTLSEKIKNILYQNCCEEKNFKILTLLIQIIQILFIQQMHELNDFILLFLNKRKELELLDCSFEELQYKNNLNKQIQDFILSHLNNVLMNFPLKYQNQSNKIVSILECSLNDMINYKITQYSYNDNDMKEMQKIQKQKQVVDINQIEEFMVEASNRYLSQDRQYNIIQLSEIDIGNQLLIKQKIQTIQQCSSYMLNNKQIFDKLNVEELASLENISSIQIV